MEKVDDSNQAGIRVDSTSSLFLGSDSTTVVLWQVAMFWIEQGAKVFYIRPTPHTKLPSDVHGTTTIQENLQKFSNLLRFLYFPGREELLNFLFDIHGAVEVPNVLIIEELHSYCFKQPGNILDQGLAAMVFASLKDSLAVCAEKLSATAYSVASFDSDAHPYFKLYPILDIYFSKSVWFVKAPSNDKILLTKTAKYFYETEITEIVLHKNQEKSIFFESIYKIFNKQ